MKIQFTRNYCQIKLENLLLPLSSASFTFPSATEERPRSCLKTQRLTFLLLQNSVSLHMEEGETCTARDIPQWWCFFFPMALPANPDPRPLIQFRRHFLQPVGLLGQVISPSKGLYLNTGQHKHRINAYTYQTSMPCVGFEPTIQSPSERRQFMP
jgi:hypothetical protein